MAKVDRRIDIYISKLPDWSKEICVKLRTIIHKADADVVEDWRWNVDILGAIYDFDFDAVSV